MEIEATQVVNVNVKLLKIFIKVCDEFMATLESSTGTLLCNYDGYVPDFMPGEHDGDYLILDIDIDTGQIVNWIKPSPEQIQDLINGDN